MGRNGMQPCPRCRKQRDTLGIDCADDRDAKDCYFKKSIRQNIEDEWRACDEEMAYLRSLYRDDP